MYSTKALKKNWSQDKRWEPTMAEENREKLYSNWLKAIEKSFGWK